MTDRPSGISRLPGYVSLSPRQYDVLLVVIEYRAQRGYSPTYNEIGDALGISKTTVFEHVAALEKKGALVKHKSSHRTYPRGALPKETDDGT